MRTKMAAAKVAKGKSKRQGSGKKDTSDGEEDKTSPRVNNYDVMSTLGMFFLFQVLRNIFIVFFSRQL